MTRYLFIIIAIIFLASCDVANDPVRLGKQSVSEANAYAVRTEADQAALDAEQARYTREQQDAITVKEREEREAITTAQIGKVAPWIGFAIILASMALAVAVAVFMVGNASASAVSQNAKAVREMARAIEAARKAMETYPDVRGNYPLLNVPAGVKISIYNPNVESAHDPHAERAASRPALEANNILRAKTAVAVQEMRGNTQFEASFIPKAVEVKK